jgi:CelD/BcsL family acetyltransferase involved in cellulose biosynthesis
MLLPAAGLSAKGAPSGRHIPDNCSRQGRGIAYHLAIFQMKHRVAPRMTDLMQPANRSFKDLSSISIGIEPLPPLEVLGSMWKRLDAAGPHSFFLTWTWIGTWLRCLPTPPRAMLLRATRAGETVGLAVVTLVRGIRSGMHVNQAHLNSTGDPAYDCITIEHNGFASSGIRTEELWAALQDWVAVGASSVDEFILEAVDPEQLVGGDRLPTIERSEYGYRAPLANFTTLDAWMSSLSRNSRQQLRRSIRAYERKGALSIDVARDAQSALTFFAHMRALHISSWMRRKNRHAFSNPFFETFHRSLIRHGVPNGTVDLLRVCAGDQAIGYLYNFRHHGTVSSYQSGFDDVDSQLRPGYVCHALAIAHYAAAGMSSYDFLGGTNQLKQSFGPERYSLCWYRLHKKTPLFRADVMARRVIGAFRLRAH